MLSGVRAQPHLADELITHSCASAPDKKRAMTFRSSPRGSSEALRPFHRMPNRIPDPGSRVPASKSLLDIVPGEGFFRLDEVLHLALELELLRRRRRRRRRLVRRDPHVP